MFVRGIVYYFEQHTHTHTHSELWRGANDALLSEYTLANPLLVPWVQLLFPPIRQAARMVCWLPALCNIERSIVRRKMTPSLNRKTKTKQKLLYSSWINWHVFIGCSIYSRRTAKLT